MALNTNPQEEGSSSGEDRASLRHVMAFVWNHWRRLPWRFGGMLAGTALAILIEVQIPRFSSELVVATERHLGDGGGLEGARTAGLALLGVFAGLSLVKQLYLRNWMYFTSQVMQRIVADGFRQVQRFSLEWHTSHFAGSTQRKITRGMWAYDSLADTLMIELGPALALLLGFSVAMYLRDPVLGLYFAGAVVVFVAVSSALSLRYVAPANQFANEADTEVGGALADSIACVSVVKAFGAEGREEDRFEATSQRWRSLSRRSWLRSMDAGAVQSVMLVILLAGLLSLVLFGGGTGEERVADAVYVVATYLVVHGYLRNIGWQVRNAQRAVNEVEGLVAISRADPGVRDLPGAEGFRPGPGGIRFEGVGFRYRNQVQPIFQGLSLEIAPGEKVALVGESGSGKSTFAKLLQRLYDVDAGRIVIDGQDIAGVSQGTLRRAISLVPQDPILFHRTLAENIGYSRTEANRVKMIEAARQAHAHEFIERLESGYETLVGERGVKLSGGERQRVAIARAILADAPILVLDEATSSLDSLTEAMIQEALAELMSHRTAVVIAHRLSTIRTVDRILVFDRGRVIEEGSHDSLMAESGGHYRRLVEMQTFGL